MVTITDLNYFLSLNINPDALENKVDVYYEDSDMIPAKAFQWLSKMSGKIHMLPYSDIGGHDNISFVAGILAASESDKAVTIVGAYDEEERNIRTDGGEYRILTSPTFGTGEDLSGIRTDSPSYKKDVPDSSIVSRLSELIPPEVIPDGMSVESFAILLEGAISHLKGDRKKMVQYLLDTTGRDFTLNLRSLYDAGTYGEIERIILKK